MEEINTFRSFRKIKRENEELEKEIVSYTVPAEFVPEEITQEILDLKAGEEYLSAVLNEDGSVTYTVNRKQHRDELRKITRILNEVLLVWVEDPEDPVSAITHSKDFTHYEMILDTDETGVHEMLRLDELFMYAKVYGAFSGHKPEKVTVNYYNTDGDLLFQTEGGQNAEDPVVRAIQTACQVAERESPEGE